MGGGKKKNPRSIPKTQADVDRARREGMLDGMMLFFDIALYTLGPDLGMDDEGMDAFNQRFNKNLDCHLHGELKDYDMRKAMWEEKGLEVQIE